MKAIVCVRWGDKYSNTYVNALKEQVERYCSYPFNFYCFTDDVVESYDKPFPHNWNVCENGNFWAYRKTYMFDEAAIEEDEILYLDLDVLIHSSIDKFFELDMSKPWIVKGWWNDPDTCRKNYSKMQSPILNSSIIRWNRGQLQDVFDHIEKHKDVIFFTFPTIDNYFSHFWFNIDSDEASYFSVFDYNDVSSYYKGQIHPIYNKEVKDNVVIELFNNSDLTAKGDLEELWPRFNIHLN